MPSFERNISRTSVRAFMRPSPVSPNAALAVRVPFIVPSSMRNSTDAFGLALFDADALITLNTYAILLPLREISWPSGFRVTVQNLFLSCPGDQSSHFQESFPYYSPLESWACLPGVLSAPSRGMGSQLSGRKTFPLRTRGYCRLPPGPENTLGCVKDFAGTWSCWLPRGITRAGVYNW